MKIKPIILSGGSGTRLWPLSRDNKPKQFFDIFNEKTNLEVVNKVCATIDKMFITKFNKESSNTKDLIHFVEDRPGHDRRYAIDSSKISNEL